MEFMRYANAFSISLELCFLKTMLAMFFFKKNTISLSFLFAKCSAFKLHTITYYNSMHPNHKANNVSICRCGQVVNASNLQCKTNISYPSS